MITMKLQLQLPQPNQILVGLVDNLRVVDHGEVGAGHDQDYYYVRSSTSRDNHCKLNSQKE